MGSILEDISVRNSPSSETSSSARNETNDRQDESKSGKITNKWAVALPPCRVCAQPASGFHYGVNTCEACKGFFRRALSRKRPFHCKGNKNCDIRGNQSSICGYCRYQWCLTLGMSKNSIKLGRYTQLKRAEDTTELTRLSETQILLTINDEDVLRLTDILLEAHKPILTNWDIPEEVMIQSARTRKEEIELTQEIFGCREVLSQDQYEDVYRQTGLDIDGRRHLFEWYAKCIERQVCGFIHFAKGIPGFQELPVDDQCNLIKSARVEIWFLSVYRGYIHELQTFFAPVGVCLHSLDDSRVFGSELTQYEYDMAFKFKCLNALTKGEIVLLKAISVTFSDRCDLREREKVENINWKLVCMFLKSLRKNHGASGVRLFTRAVDCLLALRNMTELSRKAHDSTLAIDVIKNHPMLLEVMFS